MMDALKLKKYAELLELSLKDNLGRSPDVDWLANYRLLVEAIEQAKLCVLLHPIDLGPERWEMESNIRGTPDVSHRLAQFELLLEGWDLPSGD